MFLKHDKHTFQNAARDSAGIVINKTKTVDVNIQAMLPLSVMFGAAIIISDNGQF